MLIQIIEQAIFTTLEDKFTTLSHTFKLIDFESETERVYLLSFIEIYLGARIDILKNVLKTAKLHHRIV